MLHIVRGHVRARALLTDIEGNDSLGVYLPHVSGAVKLVYCSCVLVITASRVPRYMALMQLRGMQVREQLRSKGDV
jgi:hypothetical protein